VVRPQIGVVEISGKLPVDHVGPAAWTHLNHLNHGGSQCNGCFAPRPCAQSTVRRKYRLSDQGGLTVGLWVAVC